MEGDFSPLALLICVCQTSKCLMAWRAKWVVPSREGWQGSHMKLGLRWVSPVVCGLPNRSSEGLLGSASLPHRLPSAHLFSGRSGAGELI